MTPMPQMTGLRCDDGSLLDQWSCPSLRLLVCLFVIGNGCICVYICICVFEVHSYSEDILWNATNSWGSNFQDACIYASICTICTSNEKSSLIFQRNCGREKMILCRWKGNDSKNFKNLRNVCISALSAPPRHFFLPGRPIIFAIWSPCAPHTPPTPPRQSFLSHFSRRSFPIILCTLYRSLSAAALLLLIPWLRSRSSHFSKSSLLFTNSRFS